MITVVIADDHDIYRHGLSMLLHDDERFTLVGEAKNGDEALSLIREQQPDIALLDLSMPGQGGSRSPPGSMLKTSPPAASF